MASNEVLFEDGFIRIVSSEKNQSPEQAPLTEYSGHFRAVLEKLAKYKQASERYPLTAGEVKSVIRCVDTYIAAATKLRNRLTAIEAENPRRHWYHKLIFWKRAE